MTYMKFLQTQLHVNLLKMTMCAKKKLCSDPSQTVVVAGGETAVLYHMEDAVQLIVDEICHILQSLFMK